MADQFAPPPKSQFFVGRESELLKISELFETRAYPTIISITGPNGIGKTALARKALEVAPTGFFHVWIPLAERNIQPEMFSQFFRPYSHSEGYLGAIVVLDGVDEMAQEDVRGWINSVSNFKMVQTLIITGGDFLAISKGDMPLSPLTMDEARRFLRLSTNFVLPDTLVEDIMIKSRCYPSALKALARLVENSMLPNIDGHLYELKRTEESQIIQAVRPEIITFSGELAKQLKEAPEKMFEIRSRQFEELVAELLQGQGYEVELTKATRDGGRDILARLNKGAFKFLCLIEAKKHRKDRPVGIQLVRNLFGTFCDEQANSAMLVTSSYFTKEAKQFTEKHKYQLSLKDYTDVVAWLTTYKGSVRP